MQADGPVDLVGHDWGGAIVIRLVSTRPDLVRSWVTDAAGIAHPEMEWHDVAKVWLTPGAGEDFWAQQLAEPVEARAALFELFGVPHDEAMSIAEQIDQTMADCILALYRSAGEVGKEWAPDFVDIPKPGLVFVAVDDALGSVPRSTEAAERAGAEVEELKGVAHWWMLQDPATPAEALTRFWA